MPRGSSVCCDALGRTVLARVVDTEGTVELAKFLAAHSPPPTKAQAEVLRRAATQSSPALREVADAFIRGS